MKRNDLCLNVKGNYVHFMGNDGNSKQCNSTDFLAVFLTFQIMGYTRKTTDEFDPVFSLQKVEKGWFYKTRGSLKL